MNQNFIYWLKRGLLIIFGWLIFSFILMLLSNFSIFYGMHISRILTWPAAFIAVLIIVLVIKSLKNKKSVTAYILSALLLTLVFGLFGIGFHATYKNYDFNYELGGYYPEREIFLGRQVQPLSLLDLTLIEGITEKWFVLWKEKGFTSFQCYIAWKEPDPVMNYSEFEKQFIKYSIVCQMKDGRKNYLDRITEQDLTKHNYPLPTEENSRIIINASENGVRW